jgi:hypothetical protein
MAEDSDKFHRVGGNTDPKANPPSGQGPNAVHNPNETNRGNKAGTTEKPEPSSGSGAPG